MSVQMILLPLFVQVLLTLLLGLMLFSARTTALRGQQVRWQDIALGEPRWPPAAIQIGNAFRNQFELPVLFYVLTILVIITRQADFIFVVLAWIFVLTRVAHAYVHVTSNHVPTRGMIYGLGAALLLIMWGMFMLRLLLAA